MLRFGAQIAKISNCRKYPLYGMPIQNPSYTLIVIYYFKNTFNCKQQYLKLNVLVEGGRVKHVLPQE